jgi:hypothetical protein
MDMNFDFRVLLHRPQHLHPPAAAFPLEIIPGISDLLQFLQDTARNNQPPG